MTRRPVAALMALVLLALLACKKRTPAEKKAELEARRAWVTQASTSFQAMHRGFAERPSKKEAKCPDSQIAENEKKLKRKSHFMLTVDYEFLTRFVKPATPIDKKKKNLWKYLTSLELRPLVHESKMPAGYGSRDLARRSREMFEQNAYILVFKSTERLLPKVEEGEKHYDGGHWHGYVGVFDLTQNKYVCHTYVAAENKGEIEEDDEGLLRNTYEESAMDDLRERLESRTEKRLKRVSSSVRGLHLL